MFNHIVGLTEMMYLCTMDMSLKVEGIEELNKALTQLFILSENEAKKELHNGAQMIIGKAKETSPVVEGVLKNSWTILKSEADGLILTVGTRTFYAPYIEFGTRAMVNAHGEHDPENPVTDWAAKRKRGATNQQMPVLAPAYLTSKDEILKSIGEAIKKKMR